MSGFALRDDVGEPAVGSSVLDGRLELPRLVLKQSALDHNVATMQSFCDARGVSIAPHAKTTMAPAIIGRQLQAGAWGMTVATLQQLRVCLELGAPRLLLANELVSECGAEWLAGTLAERTGQEAYCLVDSVRGVERLASGVRRSPRARPLPVLLEIGVAGGRAGVRSRADARLVAASVLESDGLVLAGVEGFEGILGKGRSPDELARVDAFLEEMAATAAILEADGFLDEAPEIILSAGGSLYFDRVATVLKQAVLRRPARVVLRSGCYVTHDHGSYGGPAPLTGSEDEVGFRAALELWSEILSVPERGCSIAGFGKREAPFDAALPVVIGRVGAGSGEIEPLAGVTVARINDQHAYLESAGGGRLEVGDRVVCGVVHPCIAFDKWRRVPIVDDSYRVVEIAETRF
jgi:D-serine dehydratase